MLFLTEGLLLRQMESDSLLNNYSVGFDSLNVSTHLTLLDLQPKRSGDHLGRGAREASHERLASRTSPRFGGETRGFEARSYECDDQP